MFKPGDKVRCVTSDYGNETVGKVYIVAEEKVKGVTWQGWFNVEADDDGNFQGYPERNFELVKENTMKISYLILNESVVLNYGGKTLNVASSDDRFALILEAIRAANGDDAKLATSIPEIVEIERKYNGDGIELKDGLLVANNEPLPAELEARILKFKELKLPYAPLLKFWDNLKQNPSFNSRKMLFQFLEHNGHPLTTDGCFIAYRGVTEDFKDVHTKTFDNKVGSVCEMPRSQVNDNPNETCSSGLHVACFDYAKGFGPKLIEVKVNPSDVVCVPVDYNGTKMRVCRFEVVAEGSVIKDSVLEDLECDDDDCCADCGGNISDGECRCEEETCATCEYELDDCECENEELPRPARKWN